MPKDGLHQTGDIQQREREIRGKLQHQAHSSRAVFDMYTGDCTDGQVV